MKTRKYRCIRAPDFQRRLFDRMIIKHMGPFKTEKEFWNAFFVEEQLCKVPRGVSGTKRFNMIVQSMMIRRFLALKPWKRW